MNTFLLKLKKLFNQVRGLFPSALPTGMSQFDAWHEKLVATYDLPTQDRDSVRYALATMILHLGPTAAFKPQYYFVLAIRSACAKQVAGAAFQEIKLRQQAEEKARQEAAHKLAAVTAPNPAVLSIESKR